MSIAKLQDVQALLELQCLSSSDVSESPFFTNVISHYQNVGIFP